MFLEPICELQERERNILKYELGDQKFKIFGDCSWIIRKVAACSERINDTSRNVF